MWFWISELHGLGACMLWVGCPELTHQNLGRAISDILKEADLNVSEAWICLPQLVHITSSRIWVLGQFSWASQGFWPEVPHPIIVYIELCYIQILRLWLWLSCLKTCFLRFSSLYHAWKWCSELPYIGLDFVRICPSCQILTKLMINEPTSPILILISHFPYMTSHVWVLRAHFSYLMRRDYM